MKSKRGKFLFPKFSSQDIVILLIIFIIGTAFRLYTLDVGLFGDEHHTVRTAFCFPFSYIISQNWGSFFYIIIVHLILPLGKFEVVSRIPAFIFGILGIYAVYITAKLFFGRKEALFAASYLAFSPYHIYWSQFARGYSTLLFFSLLSLYFFFKSIKENTIRSWFSYIFFSILQIYTHLSGLLCFPVYVSFIGVLIGGKLMKSRTLWTIDKKRILRFIVSTTLILVIVFILYLPDLKTPGGTESLAFGRLGKVTRPLGENLKIFGQIIFQAFSWKTQSWNPNITFSILIGVFFIIGVTASLKNFQNQIILTFLYITIPVILFLLGKPLNTAIRNAPDRYFIYFLPLFFFLIAKGVSAFWSTLINSYLRISKEKVSSNRISQYVSIGMLTTFLIFGVLLIPQLKSHYLYRKNLPDFRGALEYVNRHIRNDDIFVFEGSFLFTFDESHIMDGFPIYIDDYYKKTDLIRVNKYDLLKHCKEIIHQKRQLWGIVYTSEGDISNEMVNSAIIKKFKKISVIRFDRDVLLKNLKKLLKTFCVLREDDKEDYHLILTQIYILEDNIGKAEQEIQILKGINSLDPIEKKKLRPNRKIHILYNRAQIYRMISNDLLSRRRYKESFRSFIKYASLLKSINRIDAATKSLEEVLAHRINTEDRDWLVAQFINLLLFEEGIYFTWQDSDGWHIRWKSKKGANFDGKIVSLSRISMVEKYQFGEKDQCNHSDHFIKFNCISFDEKIYGLDFQILHKSELKLYFFVNEKRVPRKIFIRGKRKALKIIPFSINTLRCKLGQVMYYAF